MLKHILLAGLLACVGVVWSAEPTPFLRADEWTLRNRKSGEAERLTLETRPLPGPGESCPAVVWRDLTFRSAELTTNRVKTRIEPFKSADVTLNCHFPEPIALRRIVIRLVDAKGETFQFANAQTGVFEGRMALRYQIQSDPVNTKSSWGGNSDRKFDWPLRFAGIAIDGAPATPKNGVVGIESVGWIADHEQLSGALHLAHPLTLLVSGEDKAPDLVLANRGGENAALTGEIVITDGWEQIQRQPVRCDVPAGGETRIGLQADFSRQGVWVVRYDLKSADGKPVKGEFRFGRMAPAGPTPERAEPFLFGLCGHPERFSPQEGALEALAAGLCGAKIYRVDFAWARIQPAADKWNFQVYDRLVNDFGKHHVELECLLGYDVPWAVVKGYRPLNPDAAKRPKLPEAGLYAKFAATVAERYRNQIRYFEIWNEPDLVTFANFPFPEYLKLLAAGRNAIKQVYPDAVVMNGGIASVSSDDKPSRFRHNGWIDMMLKAGPQPFDLFAYHGHGPADRYKEDLQLLRRRGLIGPDKKWQWYSNETAETSAQIGELRQAGSLFRKLLTAWSFGAAGYNWYLLREKSYYPMGHHERHFGLLTPDFAPKAGYITYNMLANTYRGARFLREVPMGDQVSAYLFEGRDKQGLLAIWNNGNSGGDNIVQLGNIPAGSAIIDLFGNETALNVENGTINLALGGEPFTLKMPRVPSQDVALRGELLSYRFPQQTLLGEKAVAFPIAIVNPSRQPLTIALTAELPRGVEMDKYPGTVIVAPGETYRFRWTVRATAAFKSSISDPATIALRIAAGDLGSVTLRHRVVSRTDGDMPLFVLDNVNQYYGLIPSAPGNEHLYWRGPDDLSAKVWLKRGSDALLLKIDVTDDVHVQPYRDVEVWKGDNVQFAMRLPGQSKIWKLGLTHWASGKSEVVCWSRPENFHGTVAGIRLKTMRAGKTGHTLYEAEIPYKVIGMTPEMIGSGFQFNLIVNDNDGEIRKGFIGAAKGLGSGENDRYWPIVNL